MPRTGLLFSSLLFKFFFISAMLIGLLPKYALAGCNWSTGANLGVQGGISSPDVMFELATFKMMSFKFWSNDERFPVGSLMGIDTFTLNGLFCAGFPELKGDRLDVVYAPPVGANPYGAGFIVPSSADGVALAVEFPSGSPHPGGIFLGTSAGNVTNGGLMQANAGLPSIPIRLSLIKTGPFTATHSTAASVIDFPGGIGWFKYYATGNPSLVSKEQNRLRMDYSLTPASNRGLTATVSAPVCELIKLGAVTLLDLPSVVRPNIKLSPVSASDFTMMGPIDKAAQVLQLRFQCTGTISTKASVSFDAKFPHNGGVDGVGMSEDSVDVGVQVLLNDIPVRFGQYSAPLAWNIRTYKEHGWNVSDLRYGPFDPQGLYCVKDCGQDMTNSNWTDGGAAYGDNASVETPITFKYYQTTNARPEPQDILVPFTITMNVD